MAQAIVQIKLALQRLKQASSACVGDLLSAEQMIRVPVRIGTTGAIGNMLQEFDPRRPASRLAPGLLVGMAGVAALLVGLHFSGSAVGAKLIRPASGKAATVLQHEAFAEAGARPGLEAAKTIPVEVSPGETFEGVIRRAGVDPSEAKEAATVMSKAVHFNIFEDLVAGQKIQIAVAAPRDQRGPVRLLGLSMKTDPVTSLTLSRTMDGALRLREMEEQVRNETKVACGAINGSLDQSAQAAGATPRQVRQVTDLFAYQLDFSRDIQPGDRFCMVFDRKVTDSGQTVEGGDLRYAEIEADHLKAKGAVRFYRHQGAAGEKAQFFDELGKNIRGFLLRTPIDGAHVTSTFGLRRHPILGYTRMHQGIDFGAPTGTPVFAAGDGVVAEVKLNGGYGRWVMIRHSGNWQTGYAHLSRWAPGLKPGQSVVQGQLIAYVGTTGRSTGPHLHYEVMQNGAKIDPKGAKVPSGTVLAGPELVAFQAEKGRIDAMLLAQATPKAAPVQTAAAAPQPAAKVVAKLR